MKKFNSSRSTLKKNAAENPFKKLMDDKKRIEAAFKNGKPLSTLNEVKFVRPI